MAQATLHKYPNRLFYPAQPDAHTAVVLRIAQTIPEQASVVVEDHRWLAHLAHRSQLYYLFAGAPEAEYYLIDRKVPPVTNVSKPERDAIVDRIAGSEDDRNWRLN